MENTNALFEMSQLLKEEHLISNINEILFFLEKITSIKTNEQMFQYWWIKNQFRQDVPEHSNSKVLLENYKNVYDNFVCLEKKII